MGFRHVKAKIYTEDDFFENYLVEVDWDIDSTKFIVADGGAKYLIPLKKTNLKFEGVDKENVYLKQLDKSLKFKTLKSADFIQLELKDNSLTTINSIVVPALKEKQITVLTEATYAVDFGTSNTHIAFKILVKETGSVNPIRSISDDVAYLNQKRICKSFCI
ncbi:MAG: hypothetical protein IPQ19_13735 [Bacteroidetes bacterium]|nr:hypothetical protein [Bacteroidota bacterium]